METGDVWQCSCGHIEHTSILPEDCAKCFSINSFKRVPEDMIKEKSEEEVLAMVSEEEEDED